MTRLLRTIAIAIAVVALIDPVFTVQRSRSPQLVLIDLTAAGGAEIAGQLRETDSNLVVRVLVDHRIPCEPGERCVMVADGARDAEVPPDVGLPISLISLKAEAGINVAIDAASTNASHSASAAGNARITVSGQGVTGRRTELRVIDEGAVVGSTQIDWKADSTQTIDVPWWPIASGARVLGIEAVPDSGETASFDNAIDLPVTIDDQRYAVLVFDARPSWNSTFVRRALEDDPRFLVDHRARVAPSLTTGTANGRLDAAVDATSLVIVGGPDALTAADVDVLDRFVRVRGGSLVLLPDRAPSGAAARLFPGDWSAQLLAEPEMFGALRAAELLRPRRPAFGAVSISPAVLVTPAGDGRIVVSGAMDAWRHRDGDAGGSTSPGADAFNGLWTSLAAETASLGRKLLIAFDDPLMQPASRAQFVARYRAMTMPAQYEASAVARCGAPSHVAGKQIAAADQVRLWPAGTPGAFRGELPVGSNACAIEVAINAAVANASVAVFARPRRGAANTLARLARSAKATGGVVTDEDNLQPIRTLNNSVPPVTEAASMYPMRSAMWLLPFVGCLSAEWWLRRRNGLR